MSRPVAPSSSEASAPLASWRLAVFAGPALPLAAAGLPLAVYLPPYYAQQAGLGLATVGAIFLITRLWDAVSDPVVGLLSDATRGRFGRRKPWIALGAPVFAASTVAIFMPGLLGVRPSAAWLLAWLTIFYLGWTAIQIPLSAWAGQLAAQYHQRSRVQTYFQVSGALGLLLVLAAPAALDHLAVGQGGANGAVKLAVMGAFILATLLPALAAALVLVREPPAPRAAAQRLPLGQAVRLIAGDPLLLRVLGSDFAVTLGQLVRSSLFVFFVSAYVGRPDLASGLFLLQFVFGVFAGPIWLRIGYRLGKHRTAVACELVQVAINLGLLAAAPQGLPLIAALTIAQGLAQGSGNLMLRSMVADIADKHRLESGEDRSGLLFSIFSLTGKAATATAVGVALPLLAAAGFRPGHANSSEALQALKLMFALGPALAHLLSAALIAGFSLDERRHAAIRDALDAAVRPVPAPAE